MTRDQTNLEDEIFFVSKKEIIGESLADLFQRDDWVKGFMSEVYDLFGLPTSTEKCLSKSDKILFVWGMMNLVQAMKTHEAWKTLKENSVEVEEAAYQYVKSYYEKTGKILIDSADAVDQ